MEMELLKFLKNLFKSFWSPILKFDQLDNIQPSPDDRHFVLLDHHDQDHLVSAGRCTTPDQQAVAGAQPVAGEEEMSLIVCGRLWGQKEEEGAYPAVAVEEEQGGGDVIVAGRRLLAVVKKTDQAAARAHQGGQAVLVVVEEGGVRIKRLGGGRANIVLRVGEVLHVQPRAGPLADGVGVLGEQDAALATDVDGFEFELGG